MTIMGNSHATRSIRRCLAALILLPSLALSAEEIPVAIHGMGWTQVGRIMHASDTVEYNYNGNWFQSASALVEAVASISPEWEGRLGIGAKQVHKAQGTPSSARSVVVTIEPSITQANFTYTLGGDKDASPFRLTLGYFPFNYNPDVRNLGLYLLRGTVYPNTLFSGFELEETIGFANQLGVGITQHLGRLFPRPPAVERDQDPPPLRLLPGLRGQIPAQPGLHPGRRSQFLPPHPHPRRSHHASRPERVPGAVRQLRDPEQVRSQPVLRGSGGRRHGPFQLQRHKGRRLRLPRSQDLDRTRRHGRRRPQDLFRSGPSRGEKLQGHLR